MLGILFLFLFWQVGGRDYLIILLSAVSSAEAEAVDTE